MGGLQGDDLLLGGGSDSGLKVGDLLRVGGPTVDASESLDWPMAQVVSLDVSTARARLFDPASRGNAGHVATRMRSAYPLAWTLLPSGDAMDCSDDGTKRPAICCKDGKRVGEGKSGEVGLGLG